MLHYLFLTTMDPSYPVRIGTNSFMSNHGSLLTVEKRTVPIIEFCLAVWKQVNSSEEFQGDPVVPPFGTLFGIVCF